MSMPLARRASGWRPAALSKTTQSWRVPEVRNLLDRCLRAVVQRFSSPASTNRRDAVLELATGQRPSIDREAAASGFPLESMLYMYGRPYHDGT